MISLRGNVQNRQVLRGRKQISDCEGRNRRQGEQGVTANGYEVFGGKMKIFAVR